MTHDIYSLTELLKQQNHLHSVWKMIRVTIFPRIPSSCSHAETCQHPLLAGCSLTVYESWMQFDDSTCLFI